MCNATVAPPSNLAAVSDLLMHSEVAASKDFPSTTEKVLKKRVSFYESVIVYPHLHCKNFTEDELAVSWYSAKEMEEIKNDCIDTIRLAENDRLLESNNFWCCRGLECRTIRGAQKRRTNKFLAWDAVMNEQETQSMLGEFSDEAIARAYSKVSVASQEAAHVLALADAKAVQLDLFLEKTTQSHMRRVRRKIPTFAASHRQCNTIA
jgi:hypothetical protein